MNSRQVKGPMTIACKGGGGGGEGGVGATPKNGLYYGETLPKRGTFFRIEVFKKGMDFMSRSVERVKKTVV